MPDPRQDEAGGESRVRLFCTLITAYLMAVGLAFLVARALLLRLLDALF